jgi:hypothetical protein
VNTSAPVAVAVDVVLVLDQVLRVGVVRGLGPADPEVGEPNPSTMRTFVGTEGGVTSLVASVVSVS